MWPEKLISDQKRIVELLHCMRIIVYKLVSKAKETPLAATLVLFCADTLVFKFLQDMPWKNREQTNVVIVRKNKTSDPRKKRTLTTACFFQASQRKDATLTSTWAELNINSTSTEEMRLIGGQLQTWEVASDVCVCACQPVWPNPSQGLPPFFGTWCIGWCGPAVQNGLPHVHTPVVS